MGNCFGKPKSPANFHGQGRTLGPAPTPAPAPSHPPTTRAAAPPKISSGPGRTLGSQSSADTPGAAAARAAEERVKAAQGKGKLGRQLDAQKSLTPHAALAAGARDNVAARDADALVEARNYN